MNSEDIINALNEDSLPESEEQEEEEAKHNEELDISHEQEDEDSSIALPRRSLYIDDEVDLVPIGEKQPSRIITMNDESQNVSQINSKLFDDSSL